MSQAAARCVPSLRREFRRVALPDKRLNHRLVSLAAAMERRPTASFPEALRNDAALEGAYRFFNNARVTAQDILAPHYDETVSRIGEARVFAIHDTSLCQFSGDKQRYGLGPLRKKGKNPDQGFLAHVTLAVSADGQRQPLGLLALSTLVRSGQRKKRSKTARRLDPNNESERWFEHVKVAEQRVADRGKLVHLIDREGDSYALLCAMQGSDFVVRAAHDRVVDLPSEMRPSAHDKLKRVLASAPIVLEREVPLAKRRAKTLGARRIFPDRDARTVRLAIAATSMEVQRSGYASSELPASLRLNVVRVVEVDTPAGEKPVQWILLTSLPIETPEQVAAIVDAYCTRWLIEEFFKALKTGCTYEARQLESLHALVNALAVLAPLAWRILLMRHVARRADAPADTVLTPTQIAVLRQVSTLRLPKQPTVQQVLLAVAALGGHQRNNGVPGWLTLMRGFRDLLILEAGWNARRKTTRCDR